MTVALVVYALLTYNNWNLTFKEVRANFATFAQCEVAATKINQDATTPEVGVCLMNNAGQRK